jgi:hypothetical protein
MQDSAWTCVLRLATWWWPTHTLLPGGVATGLVAVLTIAAVLRWQVYCSGPVTMMRVQRAIAAYLSLGFAYAHAHHLAVLLDPGAFNIAVSDLAPVSSWVNYSFGILTTVGYAGIVRVHPVAHTLSSGKAVTGRLYLAVPVAQLDSIQISSAQTGHRSLLIGCDAESAHFRIWIERIHRYPESLFRFCRSLSFLRLAIATARSCGANSQRDLGLSKAVNREFVVRIHAE